MTLHAEIERALAAARAPMSASAIAEAVNRAGRYRKHDGTPVAPEQIHARVSKHRELFERTPNGIALRARGSSRLDSRLEAEGAEFLVLGLLLVERIQATKAYTNFPGYDLLAIGPESNRSARIQVKSRWPTDYDGGFLIRNFDCDFVVHVALNRGYRYRRQTPDDDGRRAPQVYMLPVEVVQAAR